MFFACIHTTISNKKYRTQYFSLSLLKFLDHIYLCVLEKMTTLRACLTYEIETNDVYQDFWNDKNKFDNSDYPENSPYFNKANKKVIGKFKDEASGIPITEFIGLRCKMYSYIKNNDKKKKKNSQGN